MIGFTRDGPLVVAVLEQAEAQMFGLVVAQVAGLIEYHRRAAGEDSSSQLFGGLDDDELVDDLDDLDGALDDEGSDFAPGLFGDDEAGNDPVLARLFPDGYHDDKAASDELRGLIQSDLHAQKLDNATAMLATLPLTGGEIRLDLEEAEAWLLALNDARLALGTRLGITQDDDGSTELGSGGPRELAVGVYHLLGYAQETLVEALSD